MSVCAGACVKEYAIVVIFDNCCLSAVRRNGANTSARDSRHGNKARERQEALSLSCTRAKLQLRFVHR